ncbi:DEAD/DEAH box helicase [Leucobacter aridicollis]|uniref:DEAD/DEAH box helicase n=1 Tax=Leucobacter aridicollis TaxID=283878 RepID=UPI002103EFBC|nr:DEAD/DEAH box helicase [Leucobacter aridicollis]
MNSPDVDAPPPAQRGPEAAWRARLGELLGSRDGSLDGTQRAVRERGASSARGSVIAGGQFAQLGLQFEVREMIPRSADNWNGPLSRSVKPGQDAGSGIFQLGIRPAIRTERGWARGSLTWANIGHHGSRLSLDPAQQRWFRQLHALHRAGETVAIGKDPDWVFLDEYLSPALWTLLRQSERLGIALVVAGKGASVRLHERAELWLDTVAAGGGAVVLTPRLELDGAEVPFVETGAVGNHGVYIAGRGRDRSVHLAPTTNETTASEVALLSGALEPGGLTIAAQERTEFLADGLPELQSEFTVASSDGSVTLPDPDRVRLLLTAAWRAGHRLLLTWSDERPTRRRGEGRPATLGSVIPDEILAQELFPDAWRGDAPEWLDAEAQRGLPGPLELRGVAAAEFLTKVVPQLRDTPGVTVRVSGAVPAYRELQGVPHLKVTTVPSEREDWFDLGVLVTIEGRTVPFGPLFKALATGRTKLLLVDNTYLHLNHPAFAPLAALIAEGQDLDEWETGPRVPRHQVPNWADFEDLADESEAAVEWRELAREIGAARPVPVPEPAGITAELRSYQRDGFHWLAFLWRNRLGGILADDMGLGKTLQCLTLIAYAKEGERGGLDGPGVLRDSVEPGDYRESGGPAESNGSDGSGGFGGASIPWRRAAGRAERRPFLVVAPTSVMSNWAAEAARFAPGLRVRVRAATEAASGRTVRDDAAEADLIVTSYALFRLDFASYRSAAEDPELGIAGLILDEAQFVKNSAAQGNELAETLPVGWKLAVTGTPIENSLRELHALTKIVAPGLFPSARRFEEDYVRAIEQPAPGNSVGTGAGSGPKLQRELRARRTKELRRRIRPFMLRRTKASVAAELPEKQEQILEIELDSRHRALYDAFLQRERQKLFGLMEDLDRSRFTFFRSLTLLRMLALDATLIDGQYSEIPSAKLEALAEHARALASEGRRALVFSQFTSFLERASAHLAAEGIRTITLDGGTRNRDSVIERFRDGEVDVFLISLKAGGVGLNLTEADTVILLDPWWNPASEAQAIDRTHRIGQQKPVNVVRMIALGTIEEKVLELQRRKRALFDAVIDDEELFSKSLTADDMRDLLA